MVVSFPIPDSPFVGNALEPFFQARLPLPPSINATYQPVKHGSKLGMALTEEAQLFKQMAWACLSNPDCDWAVVNAIRAMQGIVNVPLYVEMVFYVADINQRADCDNCFKLAIDSIFFRLDLNDRLVRRLLATIEEDKRDPRLEVSIRCLLSSSQGK